MNFNLKATFPSKVGVKGKTLERGWLKSPGNKVKNKKQVTKRLLVATVK